MKLDCSSWVHIFLCPPSGEIRTTLFTTKEVLCFWYLAFNCQLIHISFLLSLSKTSTDGNSYLFPLSLWLLFPPLPPPNLANALPSTNSCLLPIKFQQLHYYCVPGANCAAAIIRDRSSLPAGGPVIQFKILILPFVFSFLIQNLASWVSRKPTIK